MEGPWPMLTFSEERHQQEEAETREVMQFIGWPGRLARSSQQQYITQRRPWRAAS